MTRGVANLRNVVGALALLALTAVSQSAVAQQPKSADPTTSAVKEEQLLQQFTVARDGARARRFRSPQTERLG
jgi:hypothetical protein